MKINLTEQTGPQQFEKLVEPEMEKHRFFLEKELAKLRTGRAHPSMIEDVKVSAYGTQMPLKELSSVTAPEASLLVVQPWDKSILPEIEKSLYNSELGETPLNDGNLIRLNIPPMSAARRQELAKIIGQKLEITKIAIRNVRKDVQNDIRDAEKSKAVSQDTAKKLQDYLQKVTDKYISKSDETAAKKEAEIKG